MRSSSHGAEPTTVSILGVEIHRVDFPGTLAQIDRWIGQESNQCRQICTVNPEFIVDAGRDHEFGAALARADLRVPDGAGVLWAAKRQGVGLTERVTGSDGIYHISQAAAARGWSVFFLGGGQGVAARTGAILAQRYPGLTVAGAYAGSPTPEEWPVIYAQLAAARPDILFVAYGHPRQDLWIDRHRAELPVRVALGVGGAFDFVAGVTVRAPHWMQRLNLEWFYRLLQEPWRWRRMMKLPLFVGMVLSQSDG